MSSNRKQNSSCTDTHYSALPGRPRCLQWSGGAGAEAGELRHQISAEHEEGWVRQPQGQTRAVTAFNKQRIVLKALSSQYFCKLSPHCYLREAAGEIELNAINW